MHQLNLIENTPLNTSEILEKPLRVRDCTNLCFLNNSRWHSQWKSDTCSCLCMYEYTRFQWVWVSACVWRAVYGAEGRGLRTSEGPWRWRGLRLRTAAQASSSHITGAIFRTSLIVPHRSRPSVATFQSCFRTKTKGKYLHLILWLHLSPCSSFFCRCVFVSAPLTPIQTVTLYSAHILLYNDLSVWSKQ